MDRPSSWKEKLAGGSWCLPPCVGAVVGCTLGALFLLTHPSGCPNDIFTVAATTLAGTFAGSGFLLLRWTKIRKTLRSHWEMLCDPNTFTKTAGSGADCLPPLPQDPLWQALSEMVRQALGHMGRQVAQLQQARAAMEVRARRASEALFHAQSILNHLSLPIAVFNSRKELLLVNKAAAEIFGESLEITRGLPEAHSHHEILRSLVASGLRRSGPVCRVEEVDLPLPSGQLATFRCRVIKLWSSEVSSLQPRSPEPGHNGSNRFLPEIAGDTSASSGQYAVASPGNSGTSDSANADHSANRQNSSSSNTPEITGVALVFEPRPEVQKIRAQEAAFLSAVSHEMKTPLASIRAYAELLADGDAEDPTTREEFFQVINTQVNRLQRLVQNLLDLARIEAGMMQVNKKPVSLNDILQEAAEVVRPAAEAKSLELITELSPLFLGVCVDRDLMLQVAINLLSNAVKYTPPGGRVTLRSRLEDQNVIFQVSDTGVGLTEEECGRVFDRFYRVKRNENLAEGTGLGLALVKSIVEELHGGHISVESTLGKGTTFTVRLATTNQGVSVSP